MNFYFFNPKIEDMKELYDHNFYGGLFIYDVPQGDAITKVARVIDQDIPMKYMVAVRPYTISPQLLCLMYHSINSFKPGKLQFNLVSGSGDIQRTIKQATPEYLDAINKDFGGILGPITDLSSNIERSNYLIDFIDMINNLDTEIPDFYVSATNEYVFDAAAKHNNKTIISYTAYKNKRFNIDNKDIMVTVKPTLRETESELDALPRPTGIWNKYHGQYDRTDYDYFTYSEFEDLMDSFKSNNIKNVLISGCKIEEIYDPPMEERYHIINFVKQYKEKRSSVK